MSLIDKILFGQKSNIPSYINYRITIEVWPSFGILEATIQNQYQTNKFTVLGEVNRINKYGSQSICIKSPLLRKFCYCL